jgi:TolB-like protein
VAVAVLPLQDMLAETEKGFLAEGLREELCNELSRYQDLVVIPCRMERLSEEDLGDPGELSRKLGARFFLEGSLRRSKEAARVSAWLIEAPHGQQVWSGSYTCSLSPSQFIETQEEIARNVAAAIGSELGVISQQVAQEARRVAPANLSTYEALLCFYHYQVTLSPEMGRQCAVALEAGVAREPEHGPLWSALASLMGNAYLLDLPGAQNPGGQAAEFARRGADLAPGSQLARGVLARSHYLRRQRRAFVRELEFALSLNPGSPLYVGLAGYTLILAGDAERGRPLLEKAIEMNPCHPGWFNHALCVDEYMKGRYESAYEETLKPGFEVRLWGPLLRAAVLGQLGRSQEARAAASEILEVVPDFECRARDITRRPILSDSIVDALLDGLRKAGLRIRDA